MNINNMMMDVNSEDDISDDVSYFYVGDEDEFSVSDSVCGSDISLTSKSDCVSDCQSDHDYDDYDDECTLWSDEDCDNQCLDDSIGDRLKVADPELDALIDVSFYMRTREGIWCDNDIIKSDSGAADDGDDDWFLDSECVDDSGNLDNRMESTAACSGLNWLLNGKKGVGRKSSMCTELTVACSDLDSFEYDSICVEKDEDDFVSDNVHDCDICENDCENYDCVGTYGNTTLAHGRVHQDTCNSLNEMSSMIVENTESVIFKVDDVRDDEYRPKMRGETYGAALEKIFSEPSFLTSLLFVPFWPAMEYMDIISSD